MWLGGALFGRSHQRWRDCVNRRDWNLEDADRIFVLIRSFEGFLSGSIQYASRLSNITASKLFLDRSQNRLSACPSQRALKDSGSDRFNRCYGSRFISGLSYKMAFSNELLTSIFPL
jgi:hypothetical protein